MFELKMNDSEFQALRRELHALLGIYSYEWREEGFILKSGVRSNVYFDGRQTSLMPEGVIRIGHLFLHLIQVLAPEAVAIGGLTMGADPLVSAVITLAAVTGYHRLRSGFLVRKESKGHGQKDLVVGGAKILAAGDLVVVCDDVITSGGSMLEGVAGAKSRGFVVPLALALVDRQESGGLANILREVPEVVALFTKSELEAGECQPFVFPSLH